MPEARNSFRSMILQPGLISRIAVACLISAVDISTRVILPLCQQISGWLGGAPGYPNWNAKPVAEVFFKLAGFAGKLVFLVFGFRQEAKCNAEREVMLSAINLRQGYIIRYCKISTEAVLDLEPWMTSVLFLGMLWRKAQKYFSQNNLSRYLINLNVFLSNAWMKHQAELIRLQVFLPGFLLFLPVKFYR